MATKSFYKEINITNSKTCRNLVSALEKAKIKAQKKVTISKPVVELNREKVKEFFAP